MKLNKSTISAFIYALGVFAIIALIWPQYNGIQNSREALALREAKLAERTSLITKVASLNEKYNQNINNTQKLDSLIPANRKEEEIVSSLQAISNQSGLSLAEISVADLQSNSTGIYRSTLINMRITGQYPQFVNFLKSLEQNLRLYDINEVTISESSGASLNRDDLNFQFKIITNTLNKN